MICERMMAEVRDMDQAMMDQFALRAAAEEAKVEVVTRGVAMMMGKVNVIMIAPAMNVPVKEVTAGMTVVMTGETMMTGVVMATEEVMGVTVTVNVTIMTQGDIESIYTLGMTSP